MVSPFAADEGRPVAVPTLAAAIAVLLVAAGTMLCAGVSSGPSLRLSPAVPTSDRQLSVIVRAPGAQAQAEATVRRLGGAVGRPLPIVDGFAAQLPATSLSRLAASPGVLTVTPDARMQVQGKVEPAAAPKPATPAVALKEMGVDKVWQAGNRGQGVTVALIDTGVAGVPDLAGRLVPVKDDPANTTRPCENLSGEADCTDNYGHGTFMAGLIAGSGGTYGAARSGVAPQARIVSVKVAGRDGSADVSTVLAAIQWVVSFRSQYGIGVLNLSLGTDSTQPWNVDPLNAAVERAWDSGIVVVVSAGNTGPAAGSISKPADDPWVVSVGAVDDRGTTSITDDSLPNFSARGATHDGLVKPDVVAPGAHVISLSAPGSAVDTTFPSTLDGGYRRGSGTSMAAALVSGSAALIRANRPTWTPNEVKNALTSTAKVVASKSQNDVGRGLVMAYDAAYKAARKPANAGLSRSSGMGSLALSRGSVAVTLQNVPVALQNPFGTVLSGTVNAGLTAQYLAYDPTLYSLAGGAVWDPVHWYNSVQYTATWYGSNWQGSNWQGSNWQGSSFYGKQDSTSTYGSNWQGSNWQGSTWYGAWDQK